MSQEEILPISQSPIKIYLRLKDKKSFILNLNSSLTRRNLQNIILQKTKISSHDLIVMYQGQQIDFEIKPSLIYLKANSIFHVINKQNLQKDIFKVSVKLILKDQEKTFLYSINTFAKSEDSVKEFVNSKVISIIEEKTGEKMCENNLSLIFNGATLKSQNLFRDYLVEDGGQIICLIDESQNVKRSFQIQKKLQNQKTFSIQQISEKRASEVEKKLSLPLSDHKSESFIKFNTFESKNELFEKERLLNEAFQNQDHSKKLKKKLKITSDLARKFENECSFNENLDDIQDDSPKQRVLANFEIEGLQNNLKASVEGSSQKIAARQFESQQKFFLVEQNQKPGEIKLGDFLRENWLQNSRLDIINNDLVQKFNEAMKKINLNKETYYGWEQNEKKLEQNPEDKMFQKMNL